MTTPSTSAETPQQPELSEADAKRIWSQAEEHDKNLIDTYNWSGDMAQSFFDGAEYATLHERAAAQARIKELEAACDHALWSGAIRFATNALDQSIRERLESVLNKKIV